MDDNLIAKLVPQMLNFHIIDTEHVCNSYLLNSLNGMSLDELESVKQSGELLLELFKTITKDFLTEDENPHPKRNHAYVLSNMGGRHGGPMGMNGASRLLTAESMCKFEASITVLLNFVDRAIRNERGRVEHEKRDREMRSRQAPAGRG